MTERIWWNICFSAMFGCCLMTHYGCSVSSLHDCILANKKGKSIKRGQSKFKDLWGGLNWKKLWRTHIGHVCLHIFNSNAITWPPLTWKELRKCTFYPKRHLYTEKSGLLLVRIKGKYCGTTRGLDTESQVWENA